MIKFAEGWYSSGEPCCFGAHLAHVLKRDTSYKDGRDEFKRRLGGINNAQVLLLFRKAGLKTNNPFSDSKWNLPVKKVIENLEKIKQIPSTKNADLRKADMQNAKLRGADLRGARVYRTDFRGADCRCTDFRDTNLWDAYLEDAIYDEATKFPEGFCPNKAGMFLVE